MQHEVDNMLKYVYTARASGLNGVLPHFLKHCSASLAPTLTLFINESLATGIVPDIFKVANVCPHFKNGDPYNARHYRPISLLPIISKLLEKVVRRQPVKHLQLSSNTPGLPAEKFSYRSNRSCKDALALVINNMQLMLDMRSICGVVFADMNEAFDRVQHSTLIHDLQGLGVSGIPLTWFCGPLPSCFQRVTTAVATA